MADISELWGVSSNRTGKCTPLKKGFDAVAVWQGIHFETLTPAEIEDRIFELFNFRIQFLEYFWTNPDIDDDGGIVEDTGGRCDFIFAVDTDTMPTFMVRRVHLASIGAPVKWFDDAMHQNPHIYNKRLMGYL